MHRIVMALLALLAAAGTDAADFRNDTGWTFGFGITRATGELDDDGNGTGLEFDLDSVGFNVFTGYQLNRYLGLELTYLQTGSAEETFPTGAGNAEVSLRSRFIALSALGMLPLGPRFGFYLRGGYYYGEGDASASLGDVTLRDTEYGEDWIYGGGFSAHLFEEASLRLEYLQPEPSDTYRLISLNVLWTFTP